MATSSIQMASARCSKSACTRILPLNYSYKTCERCWEQDAKFQREKRKRKKEGANAENHNPVSKKSSIALKRVYEGTSSDDEFEAEDEVSDQLHPLALNIIALSAGNNVSKRSRVIHCTPICVQKEQQCSFPRFLQNTGRPFGF